MMLVPHIAHIEAIEKRDLNRALEAWGHKMGPWRRPTYRGWFHGLFEHGELVAVTAAGDLIRERCGGFTREEAFELGRVCAVRPDLCRGWLRLWREFVFPALCVEHGWTWVISYQDALEHTGDLYRFDGWLRLCRSRSGTDQRSGAKGRDKWVWGWAIAPYLMERERAARGAA